MSTENTIAFYSVKENELSLVCGRWEQKFLLEEFEGTEEELIEYTENLLSEKADEDGCYGYHEDYFTIIGYDKDGNEVMEKKALFGWEAEYIPSDRDQHGTYWG